jgi:methylmalonyl-CoA carboxyltransferase large subunit
MEKELKAILEQMGSDLAKLAARVARLEHGEEAPEPVVEPEPAVEEGIPEEILLAISAAVAAYLGERVHIRQIRLISSPAWAQVGRASVQASHHVH